MRNNSLRLVRNANRVAVVCVCIWFGRGVAEALIIIISSYYIKTGGFGRVYWKNKRP